eukprot:2021854-Rhodomonas_salina.1
MVRVGHTGHVVARAQETSVAHTALRRPLLPGSYGHLVPRYACVSTGRLVPHSAHTSTAVAVPHFGTGHLVPPRAYGSDGVAVPRYTYVSTGHVVAAA